MAELLSISLVAQRSALSPLALFSFTWSLLYSGSRGQMPETELHKAARDGNLDEIQGLIADGVNINEKGAQGAPGFTHCAHKHPLLNATHAAGR